MNFLPMQEKPGYAGLKASESAWADFVKVAREFIPARKRIPYMTCFACERNLSAYIDDELTADARIEVESHLETCERCRKDYETHLATRDAASLLRSGSAPDDLYERIESEVHKQRPSTPVEDLSLIVRELTGEVRELRQTVEDLRQDLERARTTASRNTDQAGEGLRVLRANP